MADQDIQLEEGQFNMFPSFLPWRGTKSIAKPDGGHGRIYPLDLPMQVMRLYKKTFQDFCSICTPF